MTENEESSSAKNETDGTTTTTSDPPRQAQVLPIDWTQLSSSDAANGSTPAADRIRFVLDVMDEQELKESTEIIAVGTQGHKITHMEENLHALLNPNIEQLILRSHLIRKMNGLKSTQQQNVLQSLKLLELYDNQIEYLEGLEGLVNLQTLDMSYNVIRDMEPVKTCSHLQELYLANNKIKSMAGLKTLTQLRKIDLGANRIREMDADELSGLVNLEELWLGKNKIEKMQGLEQLTKLRRLDLQANRLTVIEGLTSQENTLQELYLSHNGIDDEGLSMSTGLQLAFPKLEVLDVTRNRLTKTTAFVHLTSLDELWLSGNKIENIEDVQPLAALGQNLDTIYLEYNPVQNNEPLYRKRLKEIIPSLTQIDADQIQGVPSKGSGGAVETEEERIKRLQDAVIERAKAETKSGSD